MTIASDQNKKHVPPVILVNSGNVEEETILTEGKCDSSQCLSFPEFASLVFRKTEFAFIKYTNSAATGSPKTNLRPLLYTQQIHLNTSPSVLGKLVKVS